MGKLIEVKNVSKIYTGKKSSVCALEDVSFGVERGEFISVVGPSGCGKSTLMKIVAGLMGVSQGKVIVDGFEVKEPLGDVGMVFQSPVLLKWRTVLKNVLLPGETRKDLPKELRMKRARSLLKLAGLEGFEDSYPNQLSGGMQQRVSISRALLLDPKLLLMDEPFGALDAMTREEMNLELLRIWEESKKTVLFITHSIAEAVFLSDRVIVMTPRPGRVRSILEIDLPRPRHGKMRDSERYTNYIAIIRDEIFSK